MSFDSLIKSFPQILSQPTGVAVLASVGIHGLLGLTLPYLPLASQEKPGSPQTVQLVELTPAELSRLPQAAPPPLTSLPVPNSYQSYQSYRSLPTLPPSQSSPGFSSLSRGSLSRGSLSPDSLARLRANLSRNSASQGSLSRRSNNNLFSRKTPISDSPVRLELSNRPRGNLRAADLSSIVTGVKPSDLRRFSNQEVEQPDPANQRTEQPDPANQKTEQPNPANQRTEQPDTANPTSPVASNPGTTQPPSQNQPEASTPPASSRPTTQAQPPAPSERNATTNGGGASNDEYYRNSVNALLSMGGVEDLKRHPEITGNYPEAACQERLGGRSLITAKVDAQGKVISADVTTKSSSTVFDEVALSTVRGMTFERTGRALAYQVPVVFAYNTQVCKSATESPNSTEPQNPTNN